MNYYFTGILIVLFVLLAFAKPAYPGSTQTNTSGSNTAIEGGYTSTATTTYQTGSSSNTTTNSTSNSNVKSAPPSAGAPSIPLDAPSSTSNLVITSPYFTNPPCYVCFTFW